MDNIFNLIAMASNLIAMLHPTGHGLQPNSDGLHPISVLRSERVGFCSWAEKVIFGNGKLALVDPATSEHFHRILHLHVSDQIHLLCDHVLCHWYHAAHTAQSHRELVSSSSEG